MSRSGRMRTPWTAAGALAAIAPFVASSGHAQLPLPLGVEQLAPQLLAGDQDEVAVARGPNQTIVVVWRDSEVDGSGSAIRARRFDARSGAPLGGDIAINQTTAGEQRNPAVAVAADGRFVVVWEGPDSTGPLTTGIFGSLRNANGTPVSGAGEFPVNEVHPGEQRRPAVAMQANGAFLVSWQSDQTVAFAFGADENIFGRVYPSTFPANAPTDEFLINSQNLAFDQEQPAATRLATTNGWLVAWHGLLTGPTVIPSIVMRQLQPNGTAAGPEVPLNSSSTLTARTHVSLASNTAGDAVAVWQSSDGAGDGIFARRIAGGQPVGSEVLVNLETDLEEREASVAIDDSGNFVATWVRVVGALRGGDDSPVGSPIVIKGRRNSSGGFAEALQGGPGGPPPTDGEFEVSSGGSDFAEPWLAMDPDGNFVVAWQAVRPDLDPDGNAALFRRFAHALFADGFETQGLGRWSAHVP